MAPLCYAAKVDPFLFFDCAPTPSTLAQSKERKGSNFAIWQYCNSYPAASGYSLLDVVSICAASTLLMATIVIGNVLVIIAIFNERELNSEQNWDDELMMP